MKWNKRIIIILVIGILASMTACKSSESSSTVQKQDETGEAKAEKADTTSDSKAESKQESENQEADTAESENESSQETTSTSEDDATEESDQKGSQTEEGSKTNLEGMQSQYVDKLDETKKTFEEENAALTGNESTYELKYIEDRRFDAWDAHLNEIYGVLKVNLPTDQFDQLKEEQRLWIKSRDTGAMEASETFKGTTSEHLEYSATLANLTEARCYDLVRTYMR
ncbi:lysozyme inhibitor LprI family protein [Rossellomorea marisflavi]|uniref:lysozyme inhibitor LprI family protein n=1 Tax=Rossellomorea marisflavi TaxID=189381 RepID=UPI0035190195